MCASYFASILKNYTHVKHVNVVFSRYCNRTVLGDKPTPLTENTLLGRMLIYLNKSINKGHEPTLQLNGSMVIQHLVHGKSSSLRSLNVDQIANVFSSLNTNIISQNKTNLRRILQMLDVECCLRVNTMDAYSIIKILNAYMCVTPNRITDFKFYHYATDNIERCLTDVSKEELLEFIFYVGLEKHAKKAQTLLRKCLRSINDQFIDKLTVEDLCIICNSTYRTNTKISSDVLLDKIKQSINENLSLLKDPALLITLLKTIKHNHYTDEDLLSTISCTIFFNKTARYYNLAAISHILSLYADTLHYDEELLKLLSEKGFEQLKVKQDIKAKNVYLSEQIRTKDIKNFLRALSVLGYTDLDDTVLENIVLPHVQQRLKGGHYKNNLEELIDSVLYMWMLNYRPRSIMRQVLSQNNVGIIRGALFKNQLHLNLLLTAIRLEDPKLFKSLHILPPKESSFNPSSQVENRPLLQKVFNIAKSTALDVQQFKMKCQIPYLSIVGISGVSTNGKAVNIEVLDDFTCVKNQDCHPHGFMQLKMRILENRDVPLVIICQGDVNTMSEAELHDYIKKEIKLYF